MKATSSTYAKKVKRIREAGKKTERDFFGKGRPLEVKDKLVDINKTDWVVTNLKTGKQEILSYRESKKFYGADGYMVELFNSDSQLFPRTRRVKSNPITVVGLANPQENPPRSVRANIEGIIYNRCIEIRAEKTGYKKGYYKHPFSRGSQVCIYALDNGDLLVHSKAGVKLWQPD